MSWYLWQKASACVDAGGDFSAGPRHYCRGHYIIFFELSLANDRVGICQVSLAAWLVMRSKALPASASLKISLSRVGNAHSVKRDPAHQATLP